MTAQLLVDGLEPGVLQLQALVGGDELVICVTISRVSVFCGVRPRRVMVVVMAEDPLAIP